MREPAILRLKTQPLQPLQEKGWRGLFSKSSLHSKPCQLLLNIGSVRIFTRFSTSKIATKNSKLNTENCKSASVREKNGAIFVENRGLEKRGKMAKSGDLTFVSFQKWHF